MNTRLAPVLAALALLLGVAPLPGQQVPLGLRPGQRVRVVTPRADGRGDRRVTGKLLSVAADTAVVRIGSGWFAAGETLSVALDGPRALEVSRGRRLLERGGLGVLGGLLGFELANLTGAAVSCDDWSGPCDEQLLYGFVGEVAGLALGFALFPEHWDRVTPERLRVGLAPLPAGRIGLGASIRF